MRLPDGFGGGEKGPVFMVDGDKLTLVCMGCGREYAPPRFHCDACDGLLRARYAVTAFTPDEQPGLFAFRDWLPPRTTHALPLGTVIRPSEGLGASMGLTRLAIAFSGYAPEIAAMNPTGSFKDFEATPTLLYSREQGIESLVLASAGNTARAFAYAAIQLDYHVILVIPEIALDRLWIPCPPTDAVRLVVLEGCDDYAEAIALAARITQLLGVANEGGARNVARRDGMSTAVLEYARFMDAIPEHYVQAIGSGTVGIAAWEAALRLVGAGVGDAPPMLHLAQNAPFTPIHHAWTTGKPIEPDRNVELQQQQIGQIDAPVLANRRPPYAVPGGVRDALTGTAGHTYAVTNEAARAAGAEFEALEGFAIGPASAVAVGALQQAVATGTIRPADCVLLHITGNNELRLQQEVTLHSIPACWRVRPEALTDERILAEKGRLGVTRGSTDAAP